MGVVTVTVQLVAQRSASTALGLLAGAALVVDGGTDIYPLGFVGFPLVGALILWHRPGHRIGLLCVFLGITVEIAFEGMQYVGGQAGGGPVLLQQVTADMGPWSFLALIGIVASSPTSHATNRPMRIVWWTVVAIEAVQAVFGLVTSGTASLAIVTALVVGVYGLVVTSVSRFVPGDSPPVIAFATLAAAAVARPALGRVRVVVNGRFNRQRYDPECIGDAFGARLRDQFDSDDVTAELLRLSRTTMEPAFHGMCLTEDSR